MADLVLVAASGLAREALAAVRVGGADRVVGFYDDDRSLAGTSIDGVPVLGEIAAIRENREAMVVVCAGRGSIRQALVARLAQLGVAADRYARVVHPSVEIPDSCSVGEGSILLARWLSRRRSRLVAMSWRCRT